MGNLELIEIIRKGMFETNSSSMHSIVIDKNPEKVKKPIWKFSNTAYHNNQEIVRVNLSLRHDGLSYCRQSGRPIMSADDKLYMYLVLITAGLWDSLNDPETFLYIFNERIKSLNERFFEPLGITLQVIPPKIKKDGPYYELEWLPSIEDSDGVFNTLCKFLEDDKNLYAFLFSPKSFVILGGDEYETAYTLNKLIRKGIDYDCNLMGYIEGEDA